MRVCKYCGEEKPYDPTAKKHSKASGFMSARCWDCLLLAQQVRNGWTVEQIALSKAVRKFRNALTLKI